jgi:hypothetical protein
MSTPFSRRTSSAPESSPPAPPTAAKPNIVNEDFWKWVAWAEKKLDAEVQEINGCTVCPKCNVILHSNAEFLRHAFEKHAT